jgi:hypothetical protein
VDAAAARSQRSGESRLLVRKAVEARPSRTSRVSPGRRHPLSTGRPDSCNLIYAARGVPWKRSPSRERVPDPSRSHPLTLRGDEVRDNSVRLRVDASSVNADLRTDRRSESTSIPASVPHWRRVQCRHGSDRPCATSDHPKASPSGFTPSWGATSRRADLAPGRAAIEIGPARALDAPSRRTIS